MSHATFAFIGGLEFNIFFRGLLSVLVGVVVLFGSVYLLNATNSGSRTGGLIAGAGLFGWMFLMGIIWSVYGIGWVGEDQSWDLVEINTGTLDLAATPEAADLGTAIGRSNDFFLQVSGNDPDELQLNALEYARNNGEQLLGWDYLVASNPRRGDALSSAEEFVIEEGVFGSTADYVPLQFGGFAYGGKPAGEEGDAWYERFAKKAESILVPWHSQELAAVQLQAALPQPTLPGEAPPVPTADERADVVTVIMERNRGGPIPWLVSGTRFVPLAFTIFNGIIFAIFAYLMHVRDKREMAIRAAVS